MIQNTDTKPNPNISSEEIDSLLTEIVSSPSLHFKWLNTLSLLEHIGSRKIHTSQSGPLLSEMVLRHASEEARHAAYFKKIALKVKPSSTQNFEKDSLLCGFSAVFYFQKLDLSVERSFEAENLPKHNKSFLCYLYVTKLIEERAGSVYETYDRILDQKNTGISLKGIIKEEESHLSEMNSQLSKMDPKFEARTLEFREKEQRLFQKYFLNLRKEVFQYSLSK
ncbi:hypothetical protein CH352_18490 [Leptospira hartskeerlii]|uniref:Rubrerythrin n=1 Tax=Leptospira hartskeerlii TaxID=2023177 RepID=A0A2M9XEC0_9LEPT|nr:hypothetical protein [Leptospira hartskeerlii]PJZ25994.1 hypothetical protein CH357_05675 [Leptospira hartskeerlii]PJZ31979.1 hypothetical protein CH352_18490 [Leptospira hartskeerlii]